MTKFQSYLLFSVLKIVFNSGLITRISVQVSAYFNSNLDGKDKRAAVANNLIDGVDTHSQIDWFNEARRISEGLLTMAIQIIYEYLNHRVDKRDSNGFTPPPSGL